MIKLSYALLCAMVCLAIMNFVPLHAQQSATDDDTFFHQQVLPILSKRCWECHGEDVQESDLRLDSRRALMAGGASGNTMAVVGKPQSSYLIEVLGHGGDVEMPPGEKLAQREMDTLVQWVKRGLPWPAGSANPAQTKTERLQQLTAQHWAFQPVDAPSPPEIDRSDWALQTIDRYIMAGLEQQQLAPNPPADRYTLIRRLKFDLLGLPPSFQEVTAFVNDRSPDAYAQLVERYLQSPHYGERWGRHWLDVARYADTKGYAFNRDRRYPFAYTYRDYVIRCFNEDVPYDQFITEQLAADLVGKQPNDPNLAALGFLTVGRKYNNRHLDIDDQIDVVGRGLLGLTIACARCHDHKYDPIPTEDYYSLYGVFASSHEPEVLPVIGQPTDTPEYKQYLKKLQRLQADRDRFLNQKRDEIVASSLQHATDYLVRAVTREPEKSLQQQAFVQLKGDQLRPRLVQRWRRVLATRAKPNHAFLGPIFELVQVPDDQYDKRAPQILEKWRTAEVGCEPGMINPLVRQALTGEQLLSKLELARRYGNLLTSYAAKATPVDEDDQSPGEAQNPSERPERQAAIAQVRDLLEGTGSLSDISLDDTEPLLTRAERNEFRKLERLVEAHQVESPGSPPRAMVLQENVRPTDPRVFVRGNPARAGKTVPRQFLCALTGPNRHPFENSSGRLELAEQIASSDNPLTARVLVNRIWMHHFGSPLVRTPSDFGVRSRTPVQQDLIDYLAHTFVHDNWSIKNLHRQLVLSNTYQQSSLRRIDAENMDPENTYYWRMNPRRLEFEAMRDALLHVCGQLDLTMGGRPEKMTQPPYSRRRAIYGYIDRQDLPGLYRVFDLASPDQSCPRRAQTTVPQQALFFMNSPFVTQCAEQLLDAPFVRNTNTTEKRIEALYRATLARTPTQKEMEIGQRMVATFVTKDEDIAPNEAWLAYAQTLLMSNAFMFVD